MTKDEAREIVKACAHWNIGQKSVPFAFEGIRTQEDDVLDAKREALRKAWKVLGEDGE